MRHQVWRRRSIAAAGVALSIGVATYILSGRHGFIVRDPGQPAEINLAAPWQLHVIVPGANGAGFPDGADGVAMADVDGDGMLDIASGQEQGLRVTLSFHPGKALVEGAWPTVTLPSVNMCSAEDAQFADVDADGALDIIAGCETGTALIEIFFAPSPPNTRSELLVAANWTRVQLTNATQRSMRILPHDLAGDSSLELVVGGKEGNCGTPPIGEADVGYYSSETPRTGSSWTFTPIDPVGWTQQLEILDLDGDLDLDLLLTDYDPINCPIIDNTRRGLRWLRSDGLDPPGFTNIQISASEANHRWFSTHDWDGDGDKDILDCHSTTGPPPTTTLRWWRNNGSAASWTAFVVPTPSGVGACIDSELADYDKDGDVDIALSFSHAANASGLAWLRTDVGGFPGTYSRGEISGILDVDSDVKFDNLLAHDADGDGDIDLVTSEQHIPAGTGPGLGQLYAENPLQTDPGVGGGDDGSDDDGSDDGSDDGGPGAVVCSLLTSGSGTASTSAVTASVTPTANAVVYATFQSSLAAGPTAPTSVSGNGLTWVQEETVAWHTTNSRRLTVLRTMGASPSAGTITATWAVSQTSILWSVVECTGVDTSGTNGSGATVQSVTNTGTGVSTLSTSLAALAAPSSVHLALTGLSNNMVITADADFSTLVDLGIGTGAQRQSAAWATGEVNVLPTFAGTSNAGAISIEVRAAP